MPASIIIPDTGGHLFVLMCGLTRCISPVNDLSTTRFFFTFSGYTTSAGVSRESELRMLYHGSIMLRVQRQLRSPQEYCRAENPFPPRCAPPLRCHHPRHLQTVRCNH